MALNSHNVQKAWYILKEIIPGAHNSFIADLDKLEDPLQVDTIIGVDKKADDGWENIFINVKNITPEQMEIFNTRKSEVHNSSFIKQKSNTITRIGWF